MHKLLVVTVTYFPYSGQLADRSNLRYYLTVGMLGGCSHDDMILHHQTGSAMSSSLLGLTYFFNVHQLFYFILVQVRKQNFKLLIPVHCTFPWLNVCVSVLVL